MEITAGACASGEASKTNIPSGYLLHSHGKWNIEIDGLPIENCDFPNK